MAQTRPPSSTRRCRPESGSRLFDFNKLHLPRQQQQQPYSLEMSTNRPHSHSQLRSEDPVYLRNLPVRPHHPLATPSRPQPQPQPQVQSRSRIQLQRSSPLRHQLAYPTTNRLPGEAQHPSDNFRHTNNNESNPDHADDPDVQQENLNPEVLWSSDPFVGPNPNPNNSPSPQLTRIRRSGGIFSTREVEDSFKVFRVGGYEQEHDHERGREEEHERKEEGDGNDRRLVGLLLLDTFAVFPLAIVALWCSLLGMNFQFR